MKEHKEVLKKALEDKAVRREYTALAPEFEAKRMMIKIRRN